MFLSNTSVKRPVAMSCLIIGLTLLGLNSYRKLSLELMPQMDVPFVTVITIYPGASPADIETDVAKRIEDEVIAIDGLKQVSSSCMENVCQTILEFQLDVDVDVAATDVREKLDLIRADFPEDVEDPIIQKFDINATPIVTLALTGTLPLDELYDFADNTLKDRITTIAGVAEVQLIGGAEREVHVELDRDKLAARGLTAMNVVATVQSALGVIPSGRLRDNQSEFSVKYDADLDEISEINDLEIISQKGQRCYIRDVGRVCMTTKELRQKAMLDGEKAIAIKIVKKADANAVEVADQVRKKMASLQSELPGGMELTWITDDGRFIEATNESAWINVFEGILLTAAILFFFLYNLRSLLVVVITMPLTIIIGLFFMQMSNLTLNTSTLIAIGLSAGVLITNSIVVLEAIVKRLDQTGDPKTAAMLGSKEAFIAVLASAGTNMVVLFPLSIMGSLIGRFIRPLALTMFIMTVVSLFISFTLTPLLCSILLKPKREGKPGIIGVMEKYWNRGFDKVINAFRAVLHYNEQHRWAAMLVLIATLGIFVHAMMLAGTLGTSMIEEPDKGEISVKLEFPTHYSLDQTVKRLSEVEILLKDIPLLKHRLTKIGKVEGVIGKTSEGVYLAEITLVFPHRDQREITLDELMEETRKRLTKYTDAITTISQPSIIGGTGSDLEMEIYGEQLQTLDRLALRTKELADNIPGVKDSDTTVRTGKPELRIRPRREVMSDMGISGRRLGMMIRANLEGLDVGTFKKDGRNYDIIVKLIEEPGKNQVQRFEIPAKPGKPLVLENVTRIEEQLAPVQITRVDKQRASKLLANLAPSLPLGKAVNKIAFATEEKGDYPPGYKYKFAGRYEKMAEAQVALGEAGITAVILVFLTLAAILESFKQPIFVLVTLPLALIGMIWALALAGMSLGIFEIMGFVIMTGIVVNNAILIVDQFNVHIADGIPRHKAMITATCERFRPIVMITLAAVLGMMPLAFSKSIGSEMRNGVGMASIGGILVSGVLTLILIPVLYDLFTSAKKNRKE